MGVSRSRERANRGRGSTPPPVCLSQKSQPLSSGLEGCGGSSVTKQASCKSGKDSSRQPQRHTRYTPHAQQHTALNQPPCLCASLARRLARPRKIERRRAHTHPHTRARARAHTHTHTHTTHTCPERGSTAARTGRRVHRIRDARAQPPRRPLCLCARATALCRESPSALLRSWFRLAKILNANDASSPRPYPQPYPPPPYP